MYIQLAAVLIGSNAIYFTLAKCTLGNMFPIYFLQIEIISFYLLNAGTQKL